MNVAKIKNLKTAIIIAVIFATSAAHAQLACKDRLASKKGELMKTLKTAVIQYPVNGSVDAQGFMKRVEDFISKAAAQKSDVVIFPELFTLDMLNMNKGAEGPQFERMASLFPEFIQGMKKMAADHNIAVLAGSMPRHVGQKIRNTASMIFPDGRIVYQDKIYLTPDEVDWQWEGGNELNVFDTPWGKSVILICHDCEFPLLSNMVATEFPEVIFVPSMTEAEAGFRRVRWSAQARAIEHRAYVLHTGTVGKIPGGWDNYAQASALGPSEKGFPGLLAEGRAGEVDMLVTELNMEKLREARISRGIFPARSQKQREEPVTLQRNKETLP